MASTLPLRKASRLSPVALACMTLVMASELAHAQQTAATQTITVTGIRRGIESSIATKRNADGIMEVISAEDIGKLPNTSIAESLASLPGLAGQMVGGRVQTVQIRGLSGDFAGTLLNGRQMVSTGDNRAVEFDQFPAELINKVLIYKTPEARVVGGGLSGTIDMLAVRPLDMSARAVVLNARLEKNSNGQLNANTSVKGQRFSASYIDQFADRTFGVALGFAHLDTPTQELHYKAWGYDSPTRDCITHPEWGGSCTREPAAGGGTQVLRDTYLNGFEAVAISKKNVRDGLMGVFEFKPNKNLQSTVDLYYSKFTKDETYFGLMGGISGDAWGGATGRTYTNISKTPVGAGTTLVTGATVPDVPNIIVSGRPQTREDELKSAGWNTKYKFGNGWTATADLSYSNAKRDENVIETYAGGYVGSAKALTTFNTTVGLSGFPTLTPNYNYADVANVKLSDPAGWGQDALWKKPKINDTIEAINLSGKKDLEGMFSAVEFGANYTTRGKSLEMNELKGVLKNSRAAIAVPASLQQAPTSLAFAGIPGVIAWDVMGALNSLYDLQPQALDQVQSRNYSVDEKVTTAFAQLNLDTTVWGRPLRGNLGLQYIQTDQSSTGFSRMSGKDVEMTRGTKYNDTLPSLNLSLELADSLFVKFGAAKTLARGRIDDMKAGATVSITKGTTNEAALNKWGGSGGNPELEPWRATSYDIAFEKYFNKRSYVSLAGFYKDLDTYVYKQKLALNFTGFPNTDPTAITPLNPVGIFERPANGVGGRVEGAEFSLSLDGGLWSKEADGIGLIFNISSTGSSVSPNGPGQTQKLPGLSGIARYIAVYYERNGFSARLSQTYRSAFRGEINGLHNAREFDEILASRNASAQIGYEFESGAAKGLSLLFQVNNLNNAPYATRLGNGLGDSIAPAIYNSYGRQYLLGVNYKL